MNYLTEFDLYIDIVLILYMFFANILLFFKFMLEDNEKGRCPRGHNKQIIIIYDRFSMLLVLSFLILAMLGFNFYLNKESK